MKAEFDRIYFATEKQLRGFLAGMMSDPHDREECLQETYLRLWQQLPKAVPSAPRSWLIVVARRLARDWQSRPRSEASTLEATDSSAGGAEALAVAETIRSLPEDLLETFCLRHLGGLSYAEIAAEQGLPIGTVASRIHRAIETLRQLVLTSSRPLRRSHESQ